MTHDFDPADEEAPRRPPPPTCQMPASEEAEQQVISVCALDADTLTKAIDAGLTPQSFYFPPLRLLFSRMLAMRSSGAPVSDETLTLELLAHKEVEAIGGLAYLMHVTGLAPTTAHASYFIQAVREKALLREAIRAATQTVEQAYAFTGGLDEFLQISEARFTAIRGGSQVTHRSALAARLAATRVQATAKPKEPTTRLFLADKPVATPGNLVTLISRAKTGKTAALGAAVASVIAATTGTTTIRDTFKFRSSNPNGHAVIVFDTEQSPYDAWVCYERSLKRGGDPTLDPPWLYHYALVGCTAPEIRELMDAALAHAKETHGGVFTVILDGVADLASSVNDEAECNGLVTWLRARSVAFDTPIICVIHSNESVKSGDDGRGHLGKQLIRKAESNLLLKKEGEITNITSDKQRKAPITEADGVAFRWSDEQQMHVTCDSDPETKASRGGKPKKANLHSFLQIFPRTPDKALTKQALLRYAQDIAVIKETAFRDMLSEGVQTGELIRAPRATGFVYHLSTPPAASQATAEF